MLLQVQRSRMRKRIVLTSSSYVSSGLPSKVEHQFPKMTNTLPIFRLIVLLMQRIQNFSMVSNYDLLPEFPCILQQLLRGYSRKSVSLLYFIPLSLIVSN